MSRQTRSVADGFEQRFLVVILIALALTVFIITWVGIRESRSDSFRLLVWQGSGFIEALAQAADNAVVSETLYDYFVQKRYSEVAVGLIQIDKESITDQLLIQLATDHDLYAAFVYDADSSLLAGGIARGALMRLPEFVYEEVCQLIAHPESNYVLLLDVGDSPGETIHFYLELSNNMDRVVVLVVDALYYVEALEQTQIGYLAQKMAREKGVEYIIYQSSEGIIFSSRKTDHLLSIESDPFLSLALEGDTIMHREHVFQDRKVLELVRPFSTSDYPFGLLRVGLSLEGYNAIARGYDLQMITLSGILFGLVLVVLLYLNSRRKRKEITRQYKRIKSISDTIFEKMRTGVAAVDRSGIIILANDAFEKTMGIEDSVGRNWDEAVSVPELLFEKVSSGRGVSHEAELNVVVDGVRKSLLVAVSRMISEDGRHSGLVAVVYDITRLRELEKKSARKERLSEMGDLAAGVAHEIRNPLNTISVAAQRLATEFVPTEDSKEYLSFTGQIRDETKRLNEIITRFLALARESEKRRVKINLHGLVDEFSRFIRPEAEKLGIELSIDVEPALELEADRAALKQVLSNLFNNAKEALRGRPGKVAITGKSVNGVIEIRFADSGPGIKEEIRDKVFTPYYTTKEAGTGLGLPTVHKIVSDLGGEVTVEESELGGACFVISLPV